MKYIFYLVVFSTLFTNCTHRIVRTGYQLKKDNYKICDVPIKKQLSISDTLASIIGEIKLGESGFSVACNEERAIDILMTEACALNADLILITEETRPDLWSSCYRCRATFYKYHNAEISIKDDENFNIENVQKRVLKDREFNSTVLLISIFFGTMILLIPFTR